MEVYVLFVLAFLASSTAASSTLRDDLQLEIAVAAFQDMANNFEAKVGHLMFDKQELQKNHFNFDQRFSGVQDEIVAKTKDAAEKFEKIKTLIDTTMKAVYESNDAVAGLQARLEYLARR